MLPGIHGFHWEAGHLTFVGLFITVFLTLAATCGLALLRSRLDFRRERADEIVWRHDFHDLPAGERKCRHELQGLFHSSHG